MPLFSLILNLVYAIVLALASPILLWRAVRQCKYRDGFAEKFFGRLPKSADDERVIWFHAVSVGEVLQLETLVPKIAQLHPTAKIVVTSTTNTGLAVARERFPEHCCCYFPLDFSWSVRTALRRVKPSLVVLVELELWPNFILHASKSASVAIVNGRISDRSFRGYNRIRFLLRPVLSGLKMVGTQTEEYAERMRTLGATRVVTTGSVKFDRVKTDRLNAGTEKLRQLFSIDESQLVLIAGSTQHPEEELALSAWESLRRDFPSLRLILVPRHRERFGEVASLIRSRSLPIARRSELTQQAGVSGDAVVLLDTLGELSDCWGLADVAFVGGSFGDRGGQNMIEPAAFGTAVVVGPNTVNFQDVVRRLSDAGGICVVPSAADFEPELRKLLAEQTLRERIGQIARKTVLNERGASDRTIEMLNGILAPERSANAAA